MAWGIEMRGNGEQRHGRQIKLCNILSRIAQIPNGSCIHSDIQCSFIQHNSLAGCGTGSSIPPLPGFQGLLVVSRKGRVMDRQKSESTFHYFPSSHKVQRWIFLFVCFSLSHIHFFFSFDFLFGNYLSIMLCNTHRVGL